mmetsp:Transcript_48043/g.148265  ORF Transcript_48043/g.148265 Transcript_48043/m.148265 type:complete len:266 (+) Transcript_48043:299-1096(+)
MPSPRATSPYHGPTSTAPRCSASSRSCWTRTCAPPATPDRRRPNTRRRRRSPFRFRLPRETATPRVAVAARSTIARSPARALALTASTVCDRSTNPLTPQPQARCCPRSRQPSTTPPRWPVRQHPMPRPHIPTAPPPYSVRHRPMPRPRSPRASRACSSHRASRCPPWRSCDRSGTTAARAASLSGSMAPSCSEAPRCSCRGGSSTNLAHAPSAHPTPPPHSPRRWTTAGATTPRPTRPRRLAMPSSAGPSRMAATPRKLPSSAC